MRIKALFITIFMLILFSTYVTCEEIRVLQWRSMSGSSVIPLNNGAIKVISSSNFPLIISNDSLFINANIYKMIGIKMRASKSYGSGRIFFKRIGDKDFYMQNSIEFQAGRGNLFKYYTVDMGRNPNWIGVVTQLILNPMNSEGTVEIKGFYIAEPSPMLATAALWQEFMQFEPYQPRSVNFIYGPKIGNISVNAYLYIIILVSLIIFLIFETTRSRRLIDILLNASKKIIIVSILLWVVLDLRLLTDNIKTFIIDRDIFRGKTLEEKRGIVFQNEYFDFLVFCNSRIPSGSSVDIIFPSQLYYTKEKAAYYLYPTYMTATPEYIMAYDPTNNIQDKVNESLNKGYKLFAKFREREFILRK